MTCNQRIVIACLAALAGLLGAGLPGAEEINLLSLGAGALPVVEPPTYATWPVVQILDDAPSSGWACKDGHKLDNVFVFELPVLSTITAFELDTACLDGSGRGAKDFTVETSPSAKDAGFATVLRGSLEERKNNQRFAAEARVEGRFVRLTIANNHGDARWTELCSFRGFGERPAATTAPAISGTYGTNYNKFHLRQQGTALSGCYEYDKGLFDGTIEGRVVTLTWRDNPAKRGPAVFVFSPDGKSFRGTWWRGTDRGTAPAGEWHGSRTSDEVGSCPHWSGSVSGELEKNLASSGRARLYGILFDTDSARIRPESLPTLDEVVKLLSTRPEWGLTIEGHTDSSGTPAHNQTLSEARAVAVQSYLVSKGVKAARLATAGFGASKPVADNATELGKAENRRVELVRK